MDILLFGGAFDPVHNGHLNILRAALAYRSFDKIIVMPTGTPGHKDGCHAPFAVRKSMCEKAFRKISRKIIVSDFEGKRFEKNFSYITVTHLKEEYPDAKIWFLIGGDSAITMPTWKNSEFLQKNCSFIVLPREEGDDSELKKAVAEIQKLSPDSVLLKEKPYPVSSTQLRNALENGENADRFLDGTTARTIEKYHLYDRDFYKRNTGTAKMLIPLLLKEKRARHTKNVAKLAKKLARHYGIDADKAYLAGLLHDIQKQTTEDELLFRAVRCAGEDILKKPTPVLHGYRAADFMMNEMGITDTDLLMAVRSHTTGRRGMSDLEKIIYLADMTSEERDYPEKDMLYNLAWQNLDICMETALYESLKWIREKGNRLDDDTQSAYEYFKKLNGEKSGEQGVRNG